MHFVEFFNNSFLSNSYVTVEPSMELKEVVEFFWQSRYSNQERFSVSTFPRSGSSLLFNLGSPFKIQKENRKRQVSNSAYYLRNTVITSFHQPGNLIFGVQFRVNLPVLAGILGHQDDLRSEIFPEAFQSHVSSLQQCDSFAGRVTLTEELLLNLVSEKLQRKALIVNTIIDHYSTDLSRIPKAQDLSKLVFASSKTIERCFFDCLATSPRQALKNVRIRQALSSYITNSRNFNYAAFGYYDESHFYKDLRKVPLGRFQAKE